MNKPFTAHYSAGKFCPFLVQEFPGNNFDLYFLEILWMGTYLPINHLSAPWSKSSPTPLQLRKQCWAPGRVFHSRLMQLQSCISAARAAAGTAPALPHPCRSCLPPEARKGPQACTATSMCHTWNLCLTKQGECCHQKEKQSPFSKLSFPQQFSHVWPHTCASICKQITWTINLSSNCSLIKLFSPTDYAKLLITGVSRFSYWETGDSYPAPCSRDYPRTKVVCRRAPAGDLGRRRTALIR